MMSKQLSLLDFGINENGEYVDLVEEEKIKNDIAVAEYEKALEEHEEPLVRILSTLWCMRFEGNTFRETLDQLQREAKTKCYHYGNLDKMLFIYTIRTEDDWCYFIFENEEHYLLFNSGIGYDLVDEYLTGEKTISCHALGVEVFDKTGRKIWKFGDKEKDIRYQVIINEWHMNKFATNRMNAGKPIKDFYEVEFTLSNLIKYWGESE